MVTFVRVAAGLHFRDTQRKGGVCKRWAFARLTGLGARAFSCKAGPSVWTAPDVWTPDGAHHNKTGTGECVLSAAPWGASRGETEGLVFKIVLELAEQKYNWRLQTVIVNC